MTPSFPYLKLHECEHRGIYLIRSRNLRIGAYREATKGFIGIRCKFGELYLFEEYHWDNGPPFGTVLPTRKIGVVPDGIGVIERFDPVDRATGRPVEYRRDDPASGSVLGKWFFSDTGETSPEIRAVRPDNTALFDLLSALEVEFKDQLDHRWVGDYADLRPKTPLK